MWTALPPDAHASGQEGRALPLLIPTRGSDVAGFAFLGSAPVPLSVLDKRKTRETRRLHHRQHAA